MDVRAYAELVGEVERSGRASRPGAPTVRLRQGTVVSTAAGPPPTVGLQLGGSTVTVTGVRYFAGYTPVVSDSVWVLQSGGLLIVLGDLA